jgi:acetyl-CoA C-acetyltransferase
LVVAGLIALERTGRRRVPRPPVAPASYSRYLSHVPVIAVVGLVWRRWAAEPPHGLNVTALVSGLAVALSAGVIRCRCCGRPVGSRVSPSARRSARIPADKFRRSPMSEACIVGWAHSPFGKLDDPDVEALIGRVARAAIDDAGIAPADVEAGFVSLFNNGFSAQDFPASLVLQHVPELRYRPITRYENACASGSAAVHGARDFLAAGRGRFALVIGVEKMTATPGAQVGDILLKASYQKEESDIPAGFAGVFGRIAERYFQRYGDQSDALAAIAAKNHRNGVDNPYAQMRRDLGYDFCRHVSEKNPYVAPPLKRTDCSLVSDGAAALVMTDEETARSMGKAVRFRAAVQVNDFLPISRRDVTQFEGAAEAWRRALDAADMRLDELSFVESHDCFTIAELLEYEAMGLTAPGQGARAVLEGWTAKDGRLPVNPSGGLKAKGHPIGATGVSMHAITAMQLAGQAGAMQLPKADIAGVFNMGGAAVANYVSILEAMR